MADVVIDYFNSGAFKSFPGAEDTYGGTFPGTFLWDFPLAVPRSHATDGNANTFLSLATGSHIVLGFSGGHLIDGPGDDLLINEIGASGEVADVFVSDDAGLTFTFLGEALGGRISGFDLGSIGFAGKVNAVKIVGRDALGGAPGFDLAYVEGLNFARSLPPDRDIRAIPVPPTLPLLGAGFLVFGLLGASRRRRP